MPFLLRPLKKEYDELFAATFDLKKNEKFLHHLEVSFYSFFETFFDLGKIVNEEHLE